MPTLTSTTLPVIPLLVCFLQFSSSHPRGDCDIIIATSSVWKCDVRPNDVQCHSNVTDSVTANDVGFRLPKNSSVYRLCVVADSDNPVSFRLQSDFPAGNTTSDCRRNSSNSPGCRGQPFLRLWQKNFHFLRHKRNLNVRSRGTNKGGILAATRWRDPAAWRVPSKNINKPAPTIIRERKSARESPRFVRSVPPGSAWSVLYQVCVGGENISLRENATPPLDWRSEDTCLYSLINKLIVDVRWGSTENVSLFLVFNFEKVSLSSAHEIDKTGHTVSPVRTSTSSRESNHKQLWIVIISICAVVMLISLFLVLWRNCCHGSSCDTCRRISPPHDHQQMAHEQRSAWPPFCFCCCNPNVPGSNPAPSTHHYRTCCCSSHTKESCPLKSTRDLHPSTSQSHLVTSHSVMSTSQPDPRSYGVTSHHVTPPSFAGLRLNNPYQNDPSSSALVSQQPCSRAPSRVPPRESRSPPNPDRWEIPRNPNRVCFSPPPNKVHSRAESGLIAAISDYNDHVTTRVTRNRRHHVAENAQTRSAPASYEVASLLSPSNGDPPPPSDPPPEYSEPPDYYA